MVDLSDPVFQQQVLRAAIVLLAAYLLVQGFQLLVVRVAERALRVPKGRLAAARRFFAFLVYVVALLFVLWTFEVDVTGLLAGLGIGALILGFALKDIIENWLAGIIVIGGRVFQIGDVIRVGDLQGVVTDMSLRTTSLKTYDRNEIIIPNASLLRSNIINLTGGKAETVVAIPFAVDYVYDPERARGIIEEVLRAHPHVLYDPPRREVRFVVRFRGWTTEIDTLFWIDDPENEAFIKSRIAEEVRRRFEAAGILPPIPDPMRKEFLDAREAAEGG